MVETGFRLLQDMLLDSVQDKVDFEVELFPHEDNRELAIINSDNREVLFSSDSIFGITFVGAYGQWCEDNGFPPF